MKNGEYTHSIFKADRRRFLKLSSIGVTGILLGVQVSCTDPKKHLYGNPEANFSPNVYISINGSGEVSLIAHRSEMGTGIRTSLPLVMADELEADWDQVKIVQAIGDKKYKDQNTDGSYSIRMFYTPLRKAAASVRLMLEQAAAAEWQVDVSECKAENHTVVHKKSGRSFGFGYLAEKAAALPVPDESAITLKSSKDFKYITKKTSIYDLEDIVTGKARFGMDYQPEGAKIALIARNPEPGAGVKSYDTSEAEGMDGVEEIFELEAGGFPAQYEKPLGGIVVVANNTWVAMKARDALKINWDSGPNANYNSKSFMDNMMSRIQRSGNIRREAGNIKSALSSSKKVIEGNYRVPHLSHTPMEPPCAVAEVKGNTCAIWAPVQDPQWTRRAVAGALGMELENVIVNVSLLGGGFGRKSKPDFVVEAALIAQKTGHPIRLLWTREDDIKHDFYHFPSVQHLKVGLDENNNVQAWLHRSAFPPIGGTTSNDIKEPASFEISMGLVDMPYAVDNVCCETVETPAKIRIGWLRSVANIHHAYAVGCTVDEVAEARGVDPAQNLLDMLSADRKIDFPALSEDFWNYNTDIEEFPWDTGRFRKVIETVRDKSDWGKSLPANRGMGIAAHRSFLTYVACVVEVEVTDDGRIKIPMVHYAVDCGVPVNPERIKSQFEGGAAFAASLALKSEITISKGAVEQSNFDDYFVARITDAPYQTEVHIIESEEKPTGVGEPPVPPFIPALCNAIYAATGKRIKELPVRLA